MSNVQRSLPIAIRPTLPESGSESDSDLPQLAPIVSPGDVFDLGGVPDNPFTLTPDVSDSDDEKAASPPEIENFDGPVVDISQDMSLQQELLKRILPLLPKESWQEIIQECAEEYAKNNPEEQ